MGDLNRGDGYWFAEIRGLIEEIRAWNDWREEPLKTMRGQTTERVTGSLALYIYALYVRRFLPVMCDVLSKVPDTDDRFWRLAVNLYDELGASTGFSVAHGKLIGGARQKPEEVPQGAWDKCRPLTTEIEEALVNDFRSLSWPVNLFALGPATESISDLFLEPLEHWTSVALSDRPQVRHYFEMHRPEVEYEHQLEISKVLAAELGKMTKDEALNSFAQGRAAALRVAQRHLQAVSLCWQGPIEMLNGTRIS